MQNFDDVRKALERSGKAGELEALAQSPEGQRLAAMLEGDQLTRAAKSGDAQALRTLLGSVLGTDEGRKLAANVRRLMEK